MAFPRFEIQWITDFADQAVILPVAAVIECRLLVERFWRAALCWLVSVCSVLLVMLSLKLLVGACGCGWEFDMPSLNSPSGHTASATMIYGGLFALLAPRANAAWCAGVALLIALLFASSRIALHDHTLVEVIIGGAVGLSGVVGFKLATRQLPPRPARPRLALLVLLAAFAFHGIRLPAERNVHHFAVTRLRAMLEPAVNPMRSPGGATSTL